MSSEMRECPFCGNQPRSGWQGTGVPGMDDCGYWGIDCCNAFAHADTEAEALAQWNRRSDAPNGSWLWCKLMDFCQKRRFPPAEFNDLFAIVTEAHELNNRALLARTEAGADGLCAKHGAMWAKGCAACDRDLDQMPGPPDAATVADGAVAWSVVRVGNQGAAYDPPNTHRAFTYEKQPGNVDASRLGRATDAAAAASAGDSIDRGLALLKELQAVGFGVFHMGPVAMQAKGAK